MGAPELGQVWTACTPEACAVGVSGDRPNESRSLPQTRQGARGVERSAPQHRGKAAIRLWEEIDKRFARDSDDAITLHGRKAAAGMTGSGSATLRVRE